MKIGLIADVHGNVVGLRAVLDQLKALDVTSVICAGDIVGYYSFVNESINLLRERGVVCIQGNHDAYLLGMKAISPHRWQDFSLDYVSSVIGPENRAWLQHLPSSHQLTVTGLRVRVYHGSPWDPLEEYIYPDHPHFDRLAAVDADIVVLGHTHWPMVKQADSVCIVNPGSCGQPRDYDPRASYAVLDTADFTVELHRAPYDIDAVCRRVIEEGFAPALAAILRRTM